MSKCLAAIGTDELKTNGIIFMLWLITRSEFTLN